MVSRTPVSAPSVHPGLAEALPVIEESTTSRVLVDNDVLRIVQFTFDTGQLLTEHTSPRAVSCVLTSGRMTFTVDGTDHDVAAGDVVYLSPGVPHALVALEPSRLTLTMAEASGE